MKNLSQQCFHLILSNIYINTSGVLLLLYSYQYKENKTKKNMKCTSRFVFKTSKTVSLTWLLVQNLIFITMLIVGNEKRNNTLINQTKVRKPHPVFVTFARMCACAIWSDWIAACACVSAGAWLAHAPWCTSMCVCMFCEAITVPLFWFFNLIRKSFSYYSSRFHTAPRISKPKTKLPV